MEMGVKSLLSSRMGKMRKCKIGIEDCTIVMTDDGIDRHRLVGHVKMGESIIRHLGCTHEDCKPQLFLRVTMCKVGKLKLAYTLC